MLKPSSFHIAAVLGAEHQGEARPVARDRRLKRRIHSKATVLGSQISAFRSIRPQYFTPSLSVSPHEASTFARVQPTTCATWSSRLPGSESCGESAVSGLRPLPPEPLHPSGEVFSLFNRLRILGVWCAHFS